MSQAGPEIDLRVYFAGLSVFVDEGGTFQVLLPDARKPRDLGEFGRAEPHYAVVQFDQRDAVKPSDAFGEFPDRQGQTKRYWLLDKDYLTVDSEDVVETGLEVDRLDGGGRGGANGSGNGQGPGLLPTDHSKAKVEWIAPLSGVGGAVPRLKPGLRDPLGSSLDATKPLAGTFRLDRGEIVPAAFAAELGGFVIGGFPSPAPQERQQALASVVLYKVRVRAPSVRLAAKKFDGSDGESVELSPGTNGGRRVEVWVLNRSWPGIVDQVPTRPVQLGSPNPDYIYFNDFLENPLEVARLPRAVQRLKAEIEPGIEPCDDPAMRQLYFARSGGETLNAAPCSPAYTH